MIVTILREFIDEIEHETGAKPTSIALPPVAYDTLVRDLRDRMVNAPSDAAVVAFLGVMVICDRNVVALRRR